MIKTCLEPTKNILRSFLAEIEAIKKIHQSISDPLIPPFRIADRSPDFSNVEFNPGHYLEKDNAYTWLYAEAWHFRALMHRPKPHQVPEYYNQPALPMYQQWLLSEKDIFFRGCIIPPPEEVSLFDYLQQLTSTIENENETRAVWIKSLRSFLQFK